METPRYDFESLAAVYAAADGLDFAPFAAMLAEDVLVHLPGVAMEVTGVAESVRALRMMYADLCVRQRPLRVERLGPFVVVLVEGSSILREHLDGVHVMRLDRHGRVVEFWGITTPMPSAAVPPRAG